MMLAKYGYESTDALCDIYTRVKDLVSSSVARIRHLIRRNFSTTVWMFLAHFLFCGFYVFVHFQIFMYIF